ncbi:cysteine--tRNA ligase [Sphingomonas astaxanthinifaciens]|uniref:Cysteine--tRNA ligase n=1 Tax=Sphingomonas astaxanthinifaciens DSM 22298 TaxID=1123267 RepID=A0ABQ5Z7T6_9SPHN|nr:cysteine--tRNA ligase [Sphingomonas astaxanthinifaciens]GLR48060.1 cysteine--tRNA ligase [Sphingomonas astaxanthinifaciens DSM 22298]
MIRLYDTAAREKREFTPREGKAIAIYVCGPTVYGRAHIGNARPPVVFDVLRRLLEHTYPDHGVTFARNITDVDDKIIAAAKEEGVEPSVITERFERYYLDDMRALGVRDPDIAPHATAEIGAMVAMIEGLVAKGHAYAAEGHVLFDVGSDADYGALSRRDREAMLAGARVEVAPYKKSPGDFVLWKPSAADMIGWESPWGRGRPGWHIECSAMIRAHLGETIDIHGGGIDLVFPHHENEAAQSRCAHGGAPLARFWLHNGFVDMGSEKMSKSLGNIVTPGELLAAGHKGEVLRLALLSAHYRSPLPWTESLIAQSKAVLDGWYRLLADLNSFIGDDPTDEIDWAFLEALRDDLNTAGAISRLNRLADHLRQLRNKWAHPADDSIEFVGIAENVQIFLNSARLLGLLGEDAETWFRGEGDSDIDARVAARTAAKQARNFAEADRIRDELKAEGILLEDGPGGTSWRRA